MKIQLNDSGKNRKITQIHFYIAQQEEIADVETSIRNNIGMVIERIYQVHKQFKSKLHVKDYTDSQNCFVLFPVSVCLNAKILLSLQYNNITSLSAQSATLNAQQKVNTMFLPWRFSHNGGQTEHSGHTKERRSQRAMHPRGWLYSQRKCNTPALGRMKVGIEMPSNTCFQHLSNLDVDCWGERKSVWSASVSYKVYSKR